MKGIFAVDSFSTGEGLYSREFGVSKSKYIIGAFERWNEAERGGRERILTVCGCACVYCVLSKSFHLISIPLILRTSYYICILDLVNLSKSSWSLIRNK